MYIGVLLLWIMAAVAITGNPENKTNRWFSAYSIFVVFGILAIALEDQAIPFVKVNMAGQTLLLYTLVIIDEFFTTFFIYFVPYTLLMFSLSSTGLLQKKPVLGKVKAELLFFIPILTMYLIFPLHSPYFNPDYNPYFPVIASWAIAYILSALFILMRSLIKEKSNQIKQEKLINLIIIFPATVFILFACYILVIFNVRGGYRYYLPIAFGEFFIFVALGIKYGVFGVKLKLEKYRLDTTMRAMTTGTTILNHAYKNEIAKIAICNDNIKASAPLFEPEAFERYIGENLTIIGNSVKHVLKMTARVQENIQEIILKENLHRLTEVLDDSLRSMTVHIEEKGIQVEKRIGYDAEIMCDSTHLKEVFNNIFKNAIEAMSLKGKLSIAIYKKGKELVVEIEDDGKGIAKENLPFVFDPFFSTKSKKSNFGLGLSYCYNVMKRHGGELEIESLENSGTKVFLKFPAGRDGV